MGIIFKYLKPYWKPALLAVLLMTVEVLCDLAQPTLMADIVDRGVSTGDLAYVFKIGGLMALISLVGMLGGVGCTVFASISALRSSTDLRAELFRKVQGLSFDGLDSFTPGSLVTRLTNDVAQVQNVVLMLLRIMVRAPLLCLGGIVMAVAINPRLSLVLLVALPFLAATLAFVISKGFPLFTRSQAALDKVNSVMRENLAGVRVIKAFVRSDYEVERFGDANGKLADITVKASRVVGLVMPLMFLIMNLAVVAALWLSGIQVDSGRMEVGKVIAFTTYLTQILFSLMMVSFLLMGFSRAAASAARIEEVMDHGEESDLGGAGTAARGLEPRAALPRARALSVEFEAVSFHYPRAADAPVLRELSFKVKAGSTVGILGSTGAGKSTLVNLIPRFYEADSGRVLVGGVDVLDIPMDELRGAVGSVPQDSILFSGTIADNLRWGNEGATEEELRAAAEAANALDFVEALPGGFETEIGQRGVGLSGGQRQRLCIARALVKRPSILILDDSTSAVDMATEAKIQERLRAMRGLTVIVIAQRVSSVLDADSILVLEGGRAAGEGTHEQLMRGNPIYQDIYRSQVGEEASDGR
jgi:ATP-binding cassette, subfamily B, multidrug efflux pump